MKTNGYSVTATERLTCVLEVEATSKNDALRRAQTVLSGGHYDWESHGMTLRVKKAREDNEV